MQIRECKSEDIIEKDMKNLAERIVKRSEKLFPHPIILVDRISCGPGETYGVYPRIYIEIAIKKKFLWYKYISIKKELILKTYLNKRILLLTVFDSSILSVVKEEVEIFSKEMGEDLKEIRIIKDFE